MKIFLIYSGFSYLFRAISYLFGYEKIGCFFLMIFVLGEELEYLTLQRLIRGEETLGVEYLPDRALLMLSCRNCGRDCPFLFIPLIT